MSKIGHHDLVLIKVAHNSLVHELMEFEVPKAYGVDQEESDLILAKTGCHDQVFMDMNSCLVLALMKFKG